jgi:hypothetical protein
MAINYNDLTSEEKDNYASQIAQQLQRAFRTNVGVTGVMSGTDEKAVSSILKDLRSIGSSDLINRISNARQRTDSKGNLIDKRFFSDGLREALKNEYSGSAEDNILRQFGYASDKLFRDSEDETFLRKKGLDTSRSYFNLLGGIKKGKGVIPDTMPLLDSKRVTAANELKKAMEQFQESKSAPTPAPTPAPVSAPAPASAPAPTPLTNSQQKTARQLIAAGEANEDQIQNYKNFPSLRGETDKPSEQQQQIAKRLEGTVDPAKEVLSQREKIARIRSNFANKRQADFQTQQAKSRQFVDEILDDPRRWKMTGSTASGEGRTVNRMMTGDPSGRRDIRSTAAQESERGRRRFFDGRKKRREKRREERVVGGGRNNSPRYGFGAKPRKDII